MTPPIKLSQSAVAVRVRMDELPPSVDVDDDNDGPDDGHYAAVGYYDAPMSTDSTVALVFPNRMSFR